MRRYLLFVPLTLALVAPAAAQSLSVERIIARNLEAKGGETLLRETTSVRTTASGTMQGQRVTLLTLSKRPFMMRNEIAIHASGNRPPQMMVQAFDGQNLWMRMGTMPPRVINSQEQVEAMKRTSQIDSPLLDYKSKGTTIILGEPLNHQDGRTLHHLIVTPKGAPEMHYYIDPKTFLESHMVIEVEQAGQKNHMEMEFGEFATIEGRKVPMAITQYVDGNLIGQLRFSRVEFNVPLADELFTLPKK